MWGEVCCADIVPNAAPCTNDCFADKTAFHCLCVNVLFVEPFQKRSFLEGGKASDNLTKYSIFSNKKLLSCFSNMLHDAKMKRIYK